jgi:hypothetical protein
MTNDIWLVFSNPKSPEREEEFNVWNNHFHLQQVLKTPGIVAATRYKLSHIQMEWMPPMRANPQWPHGREQYLTVYEIDPETDARAVFQRLGEAEADRASNDPDNDPVEWLGAWFYEAFTHPETSIEFKTPTAPGHGRPYHLWLVDSTPLSAEVEDENNRWYTTQVNLRYPGIETIARYKLSKVQSRIDPRAPAPEGEWPHGHHSYLAAWELSSLEEAIYWRRRAQESGAPFPRYGWTPPINQHRRGGDHVIYSPVTTRVTPIWPQRRD